MDCRTAQLFLAFDRPHAPELSPEDRALLGRHLAQCPACRALESSERNLDAMLGKAMLGVAVPESLESDLHAILDEQERQQQRRTWRRVGPLMAAAAGILLLLGGLLWWNLMARPVVNPEQFHEEFVSALVTPPSAEAIMERFQQQGVTMVAPDFLDYTFLVDSRLAVFQGRQVPLLQFDRGENAPLGFARVFVLPAQKFDLKNLVGVPPSPSGYRYRVETRYKPGDLYAYVIVYTGDNLDWLLVHSPSRGV